MTNAHVVAGVNDPEVLVGDSKLGADVVYYNKDLDVAVLKVPGLERPRLAFDEGGKPGPGVAFLGYPQDGPYNVQPGRIRAAPPLRPPHTYGTATRTRAASSLPGPIP